MNNDYENALKDYNEVLVLDPDSRAAWAKRHYAIVNKGELDRAIQVYTDTVKSAPDNARALHYRGRAYHEKKEYKQAIADFTSSIELIPKNAIGWFWRGHDRQRKTASLTFANSIHVPRGERGAAASGEMVDENVS